MMSALLSIEVVTLFPEMIQEAMRHGVVGRAVTRGVLQVGVENPRAHTSDVHQSVDDRPYGGGPGMVMKPEPLCAAIAAAAARLPTGSLRVAMSPQGRVLNRALLNELRAAPGLVLVAGRYEGVDERVLETSIDCELSIGDFVVSGGELPALVVIDALARLLPGVLGDERSSVEDSFTDGLLDWPHYTRPEEYAGRRVPTVLLSGDHAAIARWRLKQAVGRTAQRRPDLIASIVANAGSDVERKRLLQEFLTEGKST
jgi:tRNA (guanine37-N1)-methyltransferase